MKYIDLHSHTRYSDGTSTVENSLRCANELGLSLFSVTDHNTVGAYGEIMQKRHLFGGNILPGVELSTVFHGEVIEILGYGIDISVMKKLIGKNYLTFYDKQVEEAKLDTNAVLACGAVLDDAFVKAMLEEPDSIFDPHHETNRPYLLEELRRHPENARFFASRKEFETIDAQRFSRDYLFNSKSSLYSDQSSLGPDIHGVIDMIHTSGGLAFLAHAFVYSKDFIDNIDEVSTSGIDGIECHYGTFTDGQKEFLNDYCDKNNLYKSGGSDFHGLDMRPKNIMGLSSGEKIPQSLIEPWIYRVEQSFI